MGNTVGQIFGTGNAKEADEIIDFILAFDAEHETEVNKEKRQIFESNLQSEGLQLSYDTEQHIHFVKIHAPVEVLCRYAEILKFTFPLKSKPRQTIIYERDENLTDRLLRCCPWFCWKKKFTPSGRRIFYEFSRRHAELYNLEDRNFFNAGIRNNIVNFILERQHFVESSESPLNMGVAKLLQDKVYLCAYPLHDTNERTMLRKEWASLKKCLSLQPLDAVYEYFGAKVGLYFAWLGHYIFMLVPLSIFGLLSFIYGLVTLPTDPISRDICRDNGTILMCPQCDKNCDFSELNDECVPAKSNYLIDNNITIAFALVMSLWSVLYLKFWKRYSAGLLHNWGLSSFSEQVEHPRPQYLTRLYKRGKLSVRLNVENNTFEPVVPFWRIKCLRSFTSYSILVLFICVSLIALFAMAIYRMAQAAVKSFLGDNDSIMSKFLLGPATAGILDQILITLLNMAYAQLAIFLTNFEYHRTQTEYEESLNVKNYIFEFVNYYASLFYIAFLKNKFIGYPGKYNRVLGFRQQECNPAGCLVELLAQLLIIMVTKQAILTTLEMVVLYVMIILRLLCLGKKHKKVKLKSQNPWTKDYNLEQFTSQSMYDEYLQMVIQFGFIVLFGLAFPLAPLLAFFYNFIELRLDALKYLKLIQRPVAVRVSDIGVWYTIMEILTKIAIFTNALIIALSTNFIPKIVYILETGDKNLNGFLNFTLAHFNTADFETVPQIDKSRYSNVHRCRYSDYRNPPEHEKPYGRPIHYWYIWIGRLAFIVIYQNVIGFFQALVAWAVPDVPEKLLRCIKRDEVLARELIIEFERESAANEVE